MVYFLPLEGKLPFRMDTLVSKLSEVCIIVTEGVQIYRMLTV